MITTLSSHSMYFQIHETINSPIYFEALIIILSLSCDMFGCARKVFYIWMSYFALNDILASIYGTIKVFQENGPFQCQMSAFIHNEDSTLETQRLKNATST